MSVEKNQNTGDKQNSIAPSNNDNNMIWQELVGESDDDDSFEGYDTSKAFSVSDEKQSKIPRIGLGGLGSRSSFVSGGMLLGCAPRDWDRSLLGATTPSSSQSPQSTTEETKATTLNSASGRSSIPMATEPQNQTTIHATVQPQNAVDFGEHHLPPLDPKAKNSTDNLKAAVQQSHVHFGDLTEQARQTQQQIFSSDTRPDFHQGFFAAGNVDDHSSSDSTMTPISRSINTSRSLPSVGTTTTTSSSSSSSCSYSSSAIMPPPPPPGFGSAFNDPLYNNSYNPAHRNRNLPPIGTPNAPLFRPPNPTTPTLQTGPMIGQSDPLPGITNPLLFGNNGTFQSQQNIESSSNLPLNTYNFESQGPNIIGGVPLIRSPSQQTHHSQQQSTDGQSGQQPTIPSLFSPTYSNNNEKINLTDSSQPSASSKKKKKKKGGDQQQPSAPKAELHMLYAKPPRRKIVSADYFHTYHDAGEAHTLRWTCIFVCPISGELFFSVPFLSDGSGTPIPEPRYESTFALSTSGVNRYWFTKKIHSEHGAAAIAHDCLVYRDYMASVAAEAALDHNTLFGQANSSTSSQATTGEVPLPFLSTINIKPYLENEAVYDIPMNVPTNIRDLIFAQQQSIQQVTGIFRG